MGADKHPAECTARCAHEAPAEPREATGCDGELLDESIADPALRGALDRFARMSGRGLELLGLRGQVLHVAGSRPDAGAVVRPVELDGVAYGLARIEGPDDAMAADVLACVHHLLAERLRAENEKNALAGDILAKLQELSVLYDVSDALAKAHDLGSVGEEVISHAAEIISPDQAAFVTYDAERSQVRIVALAGASEGVPRAWKAVEPDAFTWAALNAPEALVLNDMSDLDRVRLRRDLGPTADRVQHLLVVPTCTSNGPVGVVLLARHVGRPPFTSVDAKLVRALASQAAVSAGHLKLHEESKEMFFSTVWSLASAVDAKDAYTHGHSQRVARYSAAVGRELGFDEREIERLELSAILHDVGKIGVPEAILNKPDRLTPAEMAVMRTHPEKGAEILSTIRAMRDIVPGVLHHHERFDGCGYPSGLKGENIPLQARIILVADTFDAMTSTRPYRNALPVQAAVDEIRRCTGTQFDPRIAEVFVDLVERGIIRPIDSTQPVPAREGTRA